MHRVSKYHASKSTGMGDAHAWSISGKLSVFENKSPKPLSTQSRLPTRNEFRFTEVVGGRHLGLEGSELSAVLRELYVKIRVCYIEEFCDLLLDIFSAAWQDPSFDTWVAKGDNLIYRSQYYL